MMGGSGGGGAGDGGSTGGRGGDTDPDALIRDLHEDPGRLATDAEMGAIRRHLAGAPFEQREMRVPRFLRGLSASGYALTGSRANSFVRHLVERVTLDGQWAEGTTPEEYLLDLRAAIRDGSARFGVGKPRGSRAPLVYVFADTRVPENRLGPNALPVTFVLYGVERGAIITGHQASSAEAVRKAEDFRWLR